MNSNVIIPLSVDIKCPWFEIMIGLFPGKVKECLEHLFMAPLEIDCWKFRIKGLSWRLAEWKVEKALKSWERRIKKLKVVFFRGSKVGGSAVNPIWKFRAGWSGTPSSVSSSSSSTKTIFHGFYPEIWKIMMTIQARLRIVTPQVVGGPGAYPLSSAPWPPRWLKI